MLGFHIGADMAKQAWTVRDAKAKLSELLRCARNDGPQRIGERDTYVVVTEAEWERVNTAKPHLGAWLLEHMPDIGELELPDRRDRNRPSPFDETTS